MRGGWIIDRPRGIVVVSCGRLTRRRAHRTHTQHELEEAWRRRLKIVLHGIRGSTAVLVEMDGDGGDDRCVGGRRQVYDRTHRTDLASSNLPASLTQHASVH